MKYVLAGKYETFQRYFNKSQETYNLIYVKKNEKFNEITDKDTIVLLSGWWGKSWTQKAFKDILETYPCIDVEYLDGKFGAEKRAGISSEKSTVTRFDLIDLE